MTPTKGESMQQLPESLPRRNLLTGSVAALASVGLVTFTRGTLAQVGEPKPLPAYVNWKNQSDFIVHSNTTIETKRSAFGTSVITPSDQLYIRNNLPAPDSAIVADRDAWEIMVDGVKNPRTFTLRELKAMEVETTVMVLQCSGNGRGFFPSKPSGTPWQVGAAGCVIWSGVPVRAVAEAMGGIAAGMKFMTGTGGEKLPAGLDPKNVIVERSVPASAMADALLAWEMNGQPIPLAHGGPLRLSRSRLHRREQYQVRQKIGVHGPGDRCAHHVPRLPHFSARLQRRPQPAVRTRNERQVLDQFAHS